MQWQHTGNLAGSIDQHTQTETTSPETATSLPRPARVDGGREAQLQLHLPRHRLVHRDANLSLKWRQEGAHAHLLI